MRTATVQEAINGNNNDTVITPLRLKQVLSELDLSSGGGSAGNETDPIFKSSPAAGITTSNIASWNNKQDPLVSGQSIKTINGQDILGEGDITIESGSSSDTPEVFIGSSTPTSGEKVWFQPLGNLFNKETVLHTGYFLDSGKFYNHSNWVTSDYIEVRPNEQYTYSGYKFVPNDVNGIISNVYYDADKKLVSTIPRNAKKGTLTIPSNAHYIRFSIYDYSNEELNELNSFQFEKGSVATAYKPYSTKKSINVLNGETYEEFLNVDNLLTKDDNIVIEEKDPTVPAHVKAITQLDIAKWNSGTGGGGSGGGIPAVILYESESDVSCDVTLSESLANFKYVEIFYSYLGNTWGYDYTKIYQPDGKLTNLSVDVLNNGYMYTTTSTWSLSGNTITKTKGERWRFGTSPNITRAQNAVDIVINKVIGYYDESSSIGGGTGTGVSFDMIYPVGSIYISASDAVDPNGLFIGTTWERFANGKTLIGVDEEDEDFATVGLEGGSKDAVVVKHSHSVTGEAASAGAHTHTVKGTSAKTDGTPDGLCETWNNRTQDRNGSTTSNGAHTHTVTGTAGEVGEDGTGKNLQPFITVFMWQRVA